MREECANMLWCVHSYACQLRCPDIRCRVSAHHKGQTDYRHGGVGVGLMERAPQREGTTKWAW